MASLPNVAEGDPHVLAHNDERAAINARLEKASNLLDLVSPTAARSNLGLGSVDNTADTAKPVSTAQQTALNAKVDATRQVAGHALSADVTLVKADVGLGSVDNTADTAKPVSTAQQTALNLKADLASPAFSGNPTAPTPASGDNDTSLATTAFVAAGFVALSGTQSVAGAKDFSTTPTINGSNVATSTDIAAQATAHANDKAMSIGLCVQVSGTYPARPSGFGLVQFRGTSDPNALGLMLEGDDWVDLS